jgi:hypothetical protein
MPNARRSAAAPARADHEGGKVEPFGEQSPRSRLLDLLVARAYRTSAWDRLTSALRFDGRAGWEPLVDVHLERAVDLELFAQRLERGQMSGGEL